MSPEISNRCIHTSQKELMSSKNVFRNKTAFQWDVYRPLVNCGVLAAATRCQYRGLNRFPVMTTTQQ